MRELTSWTEVDGALAELGRVALEVLALEAEMGVQVHGLVTRYGGRLGLLNGRRGDLESTIEAFCTARREEFGKNRSRQFTFGKIAFRLAEKIEIPAGLEGVVIETLKKLGWDECVEVKEKLDRNALKKLTDDELVKCGVSRTAKDHFRIEPNLHLAAEKAGQTYEPPSVIVDMDKLSGAVRMGPLEASPKEAA